MATREPCGPIEECHQFDASEAMQRGQATDFGQQVTADGPGRYSPQQTLDAAGGSDRCHELLSNGGCGLLPRVNGLVAQKAGLLTCSKAKAEDEVGILGICPVQLPNTVAESQPGKQSLIEDEPMDWSPIQVPAFPEDADQKPHTATVFSPAKVAFDATARSEGIAALGSNGHEADPSVNFEVVHCCHDVLPTIGILSLPTIGILPGVADLSNDVNFTERHAAAGQDQVGREFFEHFSEECLPVMLDEFEECILAEPESAAVNSPRSPLARTPMECSDDRDDDDDAGCYSCDLASAASCSDVSPWPAGYSHGDCVGRGKFGEAYLCEHQVNGSPVIIKKVPREHYKADEFLLPLRFPHENIVRMLDKHEMGSAVYLVQDYVPGLTLQSVWDYNVTQGQVIDEASLDQLGIQMLQALEHLTQNRIIHRDIKLANIIRTPWTESGVRYVLIDFGLSEQLLDGEEVRCNRGFRGSPAYAAPECHQVCTSKVCQEGYNSRSDLWSLGVSIMQMCSFKLPFCVPSYEDIRRLLVCQPDLMQAFVRDESVVHCSPAWRELLVKMLAPRAADRPPPSDLLAELENKCMLALPDFEYLQ